MAFLDNSGDIILDAVLTDVGRRKMAEGNFRITQFALGDDEIDYGLYDKNHPSGSAYYDLTILQTPVLEAFTRTNANINYGLASFNGNLNLLYLPTAKVGGGASDIQPYGGGGITQQLLTSSIFYVAVNPDTSDALAAELGNSYYQMPLQPQVAVHIETGISSSGNNPPRTEGLENRQNYVIANDLADSNFDISVDARFLDGVAGPNVAASQWGGDFAQGTATLNIFPESYRPLGNNRIGLANYKTAIIGAVANKLVGDPNGKWQNYSEIKGPPAMITVLAVSPSPDLKGSAAKYSLYGRVAANLFGDGNTYDYIDTIVYVTGKTSGVSLQIPYRIVRKR